MKPKTIDDACKIAIEKFTQNFGTDPAEHKVFIEHVLDPLRCIYAKKPARLLERAAEIADAGMNALDFMHYLACACITEGEDRNVTYEEALQIIGARPLSKGEDIYHFSNKRHRKGFRGHPGMCFTSEDSVRNIVTDSLDFSQPVYMHTCEVENPNGLSDHDAQAYTSEKRDIVVAEVLLDAARFDPSKRWYEQKDEGAVKVVAVRELTRNEK
jgi:hypothetical protein